MASDAGGGCPEGVKVGRDGVGANAVWMAGCGPCLGRQSVKPEATGRVGMLS